MRDIHQTPRYFPNEIAAMLYGVSPTDALTFVTIAALLLGVTLGAGAVVLRQGLKVDPLALLRE